MPVPIYSSKNIFFTEEVLENFAKFTGKHLWFAKFSKSPFLQNTSERLLLAFWCNVTKIVCCKQNLR